MATDLRKQQLETAAGQLAQWEEEQEAAIERVLLATQTGRPIEGENLGGLLENLLAGASCIDWVWDLIRHWRAEGSHLERRYPAPAMNGGRNRYYRKRSA